VDSYTLADLARVTGAKRRSLQLWADAGVIRAKRGTNRAGTGTHRLFSRDEAILACIIHAFALHQISIGELLNIASVARTHPGSMLRRNFIDRAISGESDPVMVYSSWRTEDRRVQFGVGYSYGEDNRPFDSRLLDDLSKPEGFAAMIKLRTYLSKIDS
jgi:DNA-binding transcriptional MerR regulator